MLKTFNSNFAFSNFLNFCATGFGIGLMPKAPGTWGTLVAIPFYCLLQYVQLSLFSYIIFLFFAFVFGIWCCGYAGKKLGIHDHPGIVWDEIVGFFITMFNVHYSFINIVYGFCLFRLFDIWKPWPIRFFDEKIANGLGVMLDDVIAGILACICLHFINFL